MTYFRVNRLWRDEQERNYSESQDFPSYTAARGTANNWSAKGGEVWIEQRDHGRRPIHTDPKGEADPMTREHIAELREQIRSLAAKTKFPKETA